MNKVLLLACLAILITLAAAKTQDKEALQRTEREAEPGNNKQTPNKSKKRKPIRRPKNKFKKKRKQTRKGKKGKPFKKGRKPGKKPSNAKQPHRSASKPKKPNKLNKITKPERPERKPKRKYRKSNTGPSLCGRQAAFNYTCLDNAMNYLKIMKDNVGNYMRQEARAKRANKTGHGKNKKKGGFKKVLHQIVEAGGGNKSELSCNGNTNSTGAKQLKNLTNILLACEKSINASCHPDSFPKKDATEINKCLATMKSYKTIVDGCMKKSGKEACDCWLETKLVDYAKEIKTCKLSDHSKKMIAQLNACKGNFSTCKKYEDSSVEAIHACGQSGSKLLNKAKALTENVDKLGKAKETAAKLAGNSSSRGVALANCGAVVKMITQLLLFVDQSPGSKKISKLADDIVASSGVTCSDSEKNDLKGQVTLLEVAVVTVTAVLVTVKENLQAVSGTTPSAAVIAAATEEATATAASAGRRNIVARHLMNRLNLH